MRKYIHILSLLLKELGSDKYSILLNSHPLQLKPQPLILLLQLLFLLLQLLHFLLHLLHLLGCPRAYLLDDLKQPKQPQHNHNRHNLLHNAPRRQVHHKTRHNHRRIKRVEPPLEIPKPISNRQPDLFRGPGTKDVRETVIVRDRQTKRERGRETKLTQTQTPKQSPPTQP
jgi:hypothetical protein